MKLNELLVVCDVDGTLLTPEQELLSCNLEMVRLFCALGGNFTIATERSYSDAKRLLKGLCVNAPAIVCGGSEVVDFTTGEILEQQILDKESVAYLLEQILSQFPQAGVQVVTAQGTVYVLSPSALLDKRIGFTNQQCFYAPVQEIDGDWCKVMVVDSPRTVQAVLSLAQEQEHKAIKSVLTDANCCEIMPETAGKAQALKTICRKSGFALANTVAIGDYYNDITFMKTAGYSVAMGNAPAEVKLAASQIASDCRDGGVASYLYHLIKHYS